MSSNSPVVIIDSGLGGLAVVQAIRAALPKEEVVYFADTARGPCGGKSAATIAQFLKQSLSYVRGLRPKHVVVACHVMASALGAIKSQFSDMSISGIIEPGAKAAVEAAGSKQKPVIGILAAEAAVRSRAYERAIHRRRHHARLLLRPAPLLEAIVEEGRDENDVLTRLVLKHCLSPLQVRCVDVLLLGSSLYTVLRRPIAEGMPEDLPIVDAAQACAEDVTRRLTATGLLRGGDQSGSLCCLLTDQVPRFASMAKRFMHQTVEDVTVIGLDELSLAQSDSDAAAMKIPA
jgi:glutamate racemase